MKSDRDRQIAISMLLFLVTTNNINFRIKIK